MQSSLKKFSPAVFAVAVVCFVLPWVNFSCQGQRVLGFTGLQLVTGMTVEAQSTLGRSLHEQKVRDLQRKVANGLMTQEQADRAAKQPPRTDPEPFAIAVLVLTISGVALSFLKSQTSSLISGVIGVADFVLLILLKSKIEADAASQSEGLIQTSFAIGFWAVVILSAGAIVLNGYLYLSSRAQVQASKSQT